MVLHWWQKPVVRDAAVHPWKSLLESVSKLNFEESQVEKHSWLEVHLESVDLFSYCKTPASKLYTRLHLKEKIVFLQL